MLSSRTLFISAVLVAALAVFVNAEQPSEKAVEALAATLQERWGENRLNASAAHEIAQEQLQYIVDNRNSSELLLMREPEPLLTDCPKLAPRSIPSDIADLHPQDIKIVAAIGDSVSTGCNSLSSTWLNMKDYQGIAWSMGGDQGATSLPNLLGDYATLVGPALGTGSSHKGFNFAKNGAIVQDMPNQAKDLVAHLRTHSAVDFNNDWKVVTVLIGGNNLCDVCFKESGNDALAYETELKKTLDILSLMPRTFVNLVQHIDYTQIAQFKGPFCGIALRFVCECLTTTDKARKARTQAAINDYNAVIDKLAPQYRRTDFAVVPQPSLIKSIIPDKSYITHADCFHPSGSGQRMFATALWNSMILSRAEKSTYVASATDAPVCASAETRLYVD